MDTKLERALALVTTVTILYFAIGFILAYTPAPC
jgi:hypothetical protein